MKNSTLAALALFAALSTVPPAYAQNYSPWSAPVNLNNVVLKDGTVACSAFALVNSPSDDKAPAISKDGLTLIFTSNRPGSLGGNDLWFTKRGSLDDCWQEPKNLLPVNSCVNEGVPNLSPDGLWLYFQSIRPPSGPSCPGPQTDPEGADLYVSHRQDASNDFGWDTPTSLGSTINIQGDVQYAPSYFKDDATGTHFLYFGQKPYKLSDDYTKYYVSTCAADHTLDECNRQDLWEPGIKVPGLNPPDDSPVHDTRTAIRRSDGLEMILSTNRPGSKGMEDLWVSTRPAVTLDQKNWSTPEPINCDNNSGCSAWNPVGPLINSAALDGGPALSWDGTELYFYSDRTDPTGKTDLYVSWRLMAVAGPDQTVECTGPAGAYVTLDGSGSIGRHGDTLSFAWSDETGQNLGTDAQISPTLPLGSHTITLKVSDAALGTLSAQAVTHVIVRDNMPPILRLSKTSITVVIPTASATTMPVSLDGIATATDTCDPSPTVTNDAPAQFPIGVTTVTFTATDHSGNSSQKQLTVDVVYNFSGYLMPLLNDGSALYQSGRTIPAKFQLTAADGTFVSSAVATIQIFQVLNTPAGTVDMSENTVASGSSNMGNLFRFDSTSNLYIYNLSTSGFANGTHLLRTTLNDATTHDATFSIR